MARYQRKVYFRSDGIKSRRENRRKTPKIKLIPAIIESSNNPNKSNQLKYINRLERQPKVVKALLAIIRTHGMLQLLYNSPPIIINNIPNLALIQ